MGVLQSFQKFRYGYGNVTELPELPGIVAQAYRTHRSSGRVQYLLCPYPGYCGTGLTELTEVPGTGMKVLQNFQKFRAGTNKQAVPVPRVFVAPAYTTSRSSGYGHECPVEVIEVLCRVIPEVNTPGMVLCHTSDRTKITKFGYGYEFVQNSQTFWVRIGLYRTHRSPGYG